MKTLLPIVSAAIASLCLTPGARAQDASPVTGNVAVVSDYVFRGITQSWAHPAIQGGADYVHPSGFAAGTWASSVSDRSYPGGSMEWDVYASFGHSLGEDWSWRAGIYAYLYPGADLREAGLRSRSFDTAEANAALTWRNVTLKYNRSLTDYFAADREQGYTGDTRGTTYLQLDAIFPLDAAWSLALHAGRTHYPAGLAMSLANGARDASYSDYAATLKYQFDPHWSVSAVVTHATDGAFYRHVSSFVDADDTRDVGGTRGLVMVQATF
ncbi:TorF family putative porin [Luteibacter sp. CQ10]|uniref:TorF family putative porin n=1 Tax=Luteibacter sp. CQ10 TaxID=2805821 RepID=UPI0034A27D9A